MGSFLGMACGLVVVGGKEDDRRGREERLKDASGSISGGIELKDAETIPVGIGRVDRVLIGIGRSLTSPEGRRENIERASSYSGKPINSLTR